MYHIAPRSGIKDLVKIMSKIDKTGKETSHFFRSCLEIQIPGNVPL